MAAELSPHRHAVHREDAAEVRLDEDTQRVGAEALREAPRRRPDAALPAEGRRARARADRALRDRAAGRRPDRGEDVLAPQGKRADVVQATVVRLAHDRVHRAHGLAAGLGEREGHHGLDRHADGEGVGEDDGRLDRAELAHLGRARELPERVADEDGSRHLLLEEVPPVGQDGGDARSDRVALDEGHLADAHAGDVRDRVQRSGREDAGGEAEVTGARTGLGQAPLGGARTVRGLRQLHEDRSCHGVEPAEEPFHRLGLEGRAARGRGVGAEAQVEEDAAPPARDDGGVVVAHPDEKAIAIVREPDVLGRRPVLLRSRRVGEPVVVEGARVVHAAQRGRRLPVGHPRASGGGLRVTRHEAQVEDAGGRLAIALPLLGAPEALRVEATTPGQAASAERGLDRRADRRPRGARRGPLPSLQDRTRLVPARAHREDHLPGIGRHGGRGREEEGQREHGRQAPSGGWCRVISRS